jgi:hypothetical protein
MVHEWLAHTLLNGLKRLVMLRQSRFINLSFRDVSLIHFPIMALEESGPSKHSDQER